jgi:hypothetical protein
MTLPFQYQASSFPQLEFGKNQKMTRRTLGKLRATLQIRAITTGNIEAQTIKINNLA